MSNESSAISQYINNDLHPYLHNFFAMLGIDTDVTLDEFNASRQRLLTRLQASGELSRFGQIADQKLVTKAETHSRHAASYVAERLLAHTTYPLDLTEVEHLLRRVAMERVPGTSDLMPLKISSVAALARLLPPPGKSSSNAGDAPEGMRDLLVPEACDEIQSLY